jgi:hypothetical protein
MAGSPSTPLSCRTERLGSRMWVPLRWAYPRVAVRRSCSAYAMRRDRGARSSRRTSSTCRLRRRSKRFRWRSGTKTLPLVPTVGSTHRQSCPRAQTTFTRRVNNPPTRSARAATSPRSLMPCATSTLGSRRPTTRYDIGLRPRCADQFARRGASHGSALHEPLAGAILLWHSIRSSVHAVDGVAIVFRLCRSRVRGPHRFRTGDRAGAQWHRAADARPGVECRGHDLWHAPGGSLASPKLRYARKAKDVRL